MFAFAFVAQIGLVAPQPTSVEQLVTRARAARYQQDSALAAYEVVARQRMTSHISLALRLGLAALGGNRLAGRYESVARIGWDRRLGAWAEIIGARSVAPVTGDVAPTPEIGDLALVLPYYPGRDQLWPMTEMRNAMPTVDDWIAHPLESGSDSLYEFSLGDTQTFRLGDGTTIQIRELRVRPRRTDGRLVVGSLWIDLASGSLVRAAYRPSEPIDLGALMQRETGAIDHSPVAMLGPFLGTVREVIVEHGLYEGRFWLPRIRTLTAEASAKGGRVSVTLEQSFAYDRVRAVPPGVVVAAPPDTGGGVDPRTGRVRRPIWRGVERITGRCRAHGDSASARWAPDSLMRDSSLSVMRADGLRINVLLPCDPDDLVHSPTLPNSIYGSGETLFTQHDLDVLRADVSDALGMSEQAKWNPQRVTLHYGLDRSLLRYNRVEGLSAGVMVERVLGAGYSASATGRLAFAGRTVDAEIMARRTNVRDDIQAAAFRRLTVADDWGNPLGTGASLNALLFGRDDAFYYYAAGAELRGTHSARSGQSASAWRLFVERQDSAEVNTSFSLAHAINGTRFLPNIGATEGVYWGATGATGFAHGDNPLRVRIAGLSRVEAATGPSNYVRASGELTLSRGLTGKIKTQLTSAAGSSAGTLPPQRAWQLGGAHTVRGYAAGTQSGGSFWFARAELSLGRPIVRPAVFGDIGWAGAPSQWTRSPSPMKGAGAGVSVLDDLIRLEAARPIEGRGRWRAEFYFNLR